MTRIVGRLLTPIGMDPRPEDLLACVACGDLTDVRCLTPGAPDVGEVACHAGCAAFLVALFEDSQSRIRIDSGGSPALSSAPQHDTAVLPAGSIDTAD